MLEDIIKEAEEHVKKYADGVYNGTEVVYSNADIEEPYLEFVLRKDLK